VLGSISRLNTRLASAPVNASPVSSRTPAHDSGSEWVANPSLYRTSTDYTPPAFNGAPRCDPMMRSSFFELFEQAVGGSKLFQEGPFASDIPFLGRSSDSISTTSPETRVFDR